MFCDTCLYTCPNACVCVGVKTIIHHSRSSECHLKCNIQKHYPNIISYKESAYAVMIDDSKILYSHHSLFVAEEVSFKDNKYLLIYSI